MQRFVTYKDEAERESARSDSIHAATFERFRRSMNSGSEQKLERVRAFGVDAMSTPEEKFACVSSF
jgi:hypothetical protein